MKLYFIPSNSIIWYNVLTGGEFVNNIFLYGDIGVGKTTIIRNFIEHLNCSIGGFIEKHHLYNDRKEFSIISLYNGQVTEPIGVSFFNNDKFKSFTEVFEREGVQILENSLRERQFIIMDELGFMESDAKKFQRAVYEALNSTKPVVGVIKTKNYEFLDGIKKRDDVILIEVKESNRNEVLNELINKVKEIGVKVSDFEGFYFDKKRIDWYNQAIDSEYNDYPKSVFGYMKSRVGSFKNMSVLDIGAGSGAFSIPLMKEKAVVSAVDPSLNMILSLRKRTEKHLRPKEYENLHIYLTPWEKMNFNEHDYVVCAFCSNNLVIKENISKLYDEFKYSAFLIVHAERYRRNFKRNELMKRLGRAEKKYDVIGEDIINSLEEMGLKYTRKKKGIKLHQYFNSIEEANVFICNHFNILEPQEVNITKRFVLENIIKFHNIYAFPNMKKVDIIEIIKQER